MKIWRKRLTYWLNELINYEAVYRTAPATPGLLNIQPDNISYILSATRSLTVGQLLKTTWKVNTVTIAAFNVGKPRDAESWDPPSVDIPRAAVIQYRALLQARARQDPGVGGGERGRWSRSIILVHMYIFSFIWEVSPRVGNNPIELELFCFAVKPLNWWIKFQTLCNLLCLPLNTTWSFLFTSFTC